MPTGKIDIKIKADASHLRKAVEMLTMARDEQAALGIWLCLNDTTYSDHVRPRALEWWLIDVPAY